MIYIVDLFTKQKLFFYRLKIDSAGGGGNLMDCNHKD